ncbi:BrnT family toxin [Tardiphaga sp. 1201_B9_N1_1]|jgi:uncharacterized DUF497 family protein|uniref:BrnT family toxin n=1 Tax=unclassified Tardiphaga TaxID=2631404 RepID=UPI003F260C7F
MTEKFDRESISGFDWDEEKNEVNHLKHGIDFNDATEIFFEPIILRRSDRHNEERWTALGQLGDRLIVVVFPWREETIRIISARRARKNEEREYRKQEMGRSSQGQD